MASSSHLFRCLLICGGACALPQIAMLGGQWGGDEGVEEEAAGAGPSAKHPVPKGKPSKPMGVDEFLDKGVGGALLPRKRCVACLACCAMLCCI